MLEAWFAEAQRAQWANPGQLKAQYGTASILKGRRVVFDICGNKYRLVVEVEYSQEIVLVKFIGTHKAYDAIDAETI
jgi:mRNA interferase HigB